MTKPRDHLRVSGKTNLIVSALVAQTVQWGDLFERVTLKTGQELFKSGMRSPFVYAPIDAVVSMVANTGGTQKNGKPQPDVTLNVLGSGDLVGVGYLLGEASTGAGAIVDMDGYALRANARAARELMYLHPQSSLLVQAYSNLTTAESWQWLAASVQMPVITRVAAYLLINWQTSGSKELPISHYLMASRMAIRRPSVTEALQELGEGGLGGTGPGGHRMGIPGRGLIKQADRGRIQIKSPEGLMSLVKEAWPLYGTHRQVFLDALVMEDA